MLVILHLIAVFSLEVINITNLLPFFGIQKFIFWSHFKLQTVYFVHFHVSVFHQNTRSFILQTKLLVSKLSPIIFQSFQEALLPQHSWANINLNENTVIVRCNWCFESSPYIQSELFWSMLINRTLVIVISKG